MQLSHPIQTNSSVTTHTFDHLIQEVKVAQLEARAGADFNQLETQVAQLFNQAQRAVLATILEEYDIDLPQFECNGHNYKQAIKNTKRYMTTAGEVTVERNLYRDKRNGETYCPMELRSGIIEDFWTPEAAKQAIHTVSLVTPGEAHRLFKALGCMAPSRSSLTRLPAKLNAVIEKKNKALQEQLNEALTIPKEAVTVSVSLDGVMIPTRDQVLPGDTKWGEASCGTVTFSDKEGETLSTQYYARMPEHKKRSLKNQLASTLKIIEQQRPDLALVKVADGARDNWTFLENELNAGDSVLDFYHASEHLHQALEFIYGVGSAHVNKQHKKYRGILRDDPQGITKVIKHLKYKAKRKVKDLDGLTKEINYFKNNKHRCQYQLLIDQHKPIGSGIVESACKTVVQLRCKRAGQRWEHDGGQAILRFRSLLLSDQLDTAWDFITSHYKSDDIKLPDNVVPFRRK
ncbi:MAG: hypothetical protein ACI8WB_003218 [Phenylobacterium sp.]|jgi:hypothetical protein